MPPFAACPAIQRNFESSKGQIRSDLQTGFLELVNPAMPWVPVSSWSWRFAHTEAADAGMGRRHSGE